MARAWWAGAAAVLTLAAGCTSSSAHTGAGATSAASGQTSASQQLPASASTSASGQGAHPASSPSGSVATSAGALADDRFWVVPDNPAALEARKRRAQGKYADAELLAKIANRPTAVWLGSWQAVDQLPRTLAAAASDSATPVLVAYFIPDRDCGGSSGGGAPNGSEYRAWVRALAGTLGSHRAVVVLEPDAVPMAAPGGCAEGSFGERSALLNYAVRTLKAQPQVRVYLDAGHPAWPSDPSLSVGPLRASGLGLADGFALNTSNFQTTADDLKYGDALSALVGGKHFIVDTGRNGTGPLPDHSGYRGPAWCNPPGRALGDPPTTLTGDPLADAFLWIKYPGESDGSCGLGDLPAGSWLAEYAIGLARRSAS